VRNPLAVIHALSRQILRLWSVPPITGRLPRITSCSQQFIYSPWLSISSIVSADPTQDSLHIADQLDWWAIPVSNKLAPAKPELGTLSHDAQLALPILTVSPATSRSP